MNNTLKLTTMAFAILLNIIGSFISVTFKLPIFLDTIGTFLSAFMFGPVGGILTGVATSIINGVTFDPYSLYFAPVQVTIGLCAGLIYKRGLFSGKLIPLGIFLVTIAGSLISSVIVGYVFGGITSSGTSIIVMYLKEAGVNIVASIFSTQILFDLLDKSITVVIVMNIMKILPKTYERKLKGE